MENEDCSVAELLILNVESCLSQKEVQILRGQYVILAFTELGNWKLHVCDISRMMFQLCVGGRIYMPLFLYISHCSDNMLCSMYLRLLHIMSTNQTPGKKIKNRRRRRNRSSSYSFSVTFSYRFCYDKGMEHFKIIVQNWK